MAKIVLTNIHKDKIYLTIKLGCSCARVRFLKATYSEKYGLLWCKKLGYSSSLKWWIQVF